MRKEPKMNCGSAIFGAAVASHSILAALIVRERTGRGQRVEVPLFDAAFELIGHAGQRAPTPMPAPAPGAVWAMIAVWMAIATGEVNVVRRDDGVREPAAVHEVDAILEGQVPAGLLPKGGAADPQTDKSKPISPGSAASDAIKVARLIKPRTTHRGSAAFATDGNFCTEKTLVMSHGLRENGGWSSDSDTAEPALARGP